MLRTEPVSHRAQACLDVMRRHRLLGAAPDEELHALLARSSLVSAAERDVLFREGDPGRAVVFVLGGFVKLSTTTGTGREIVLEICGAGSLFGELAVLNGWPRSADAVALSQCNVLSLGGEAFRATLTRSPEFMFALMGVLSRRLHQATEQLRDGASLPGPVRLAKALTQLAALHGHVVGTGLQLDLALSQRELGGLASLSRESINKQLAEWREKRWIELSPGHISLLSVEALRDFVDHAANT